MKICIIGASGKLGTYMVQHSLDRSHEVVGGQLNLTYQFHLLKSNYA